MSTDNPSLPCDRRLALAFILAAGAAAGVAPALGAVDRSVDFGPASGYTVGVDLASDVDELAVMVIRNLHGGRDVTTIGLYALDELTPEQREEVIRSLHSPDDEEPE